MALLEVSDLRTHFFTREGIVRAVDGVSFAVEAGRTLGIVGESGCGKSVTALSILRLLPDPPAKLVAGSIRFEGRELTAMAERELEDVRGRRIAIVFHDPFASLNPRMTVGKIVAEPLEVHGIGTRGSRRGQVARLLELVGFDPKYTNRYPHEFSGGQRQRIGIARALALNPKLIVCDEPVSALDVSIQAQILNLLKDLQHEFALSYLFIAHDLAVVRSISDTIAVMRNGRIVEQGPADQLYARPKSAYTQALLAAVPVPDPERMRERKAARRRLRAALATGSS